MQRNRVENIIGNCYIARFSPSNPSRDITRAEKFSEVENGCLVIECPNLRVTEYTLALCCSGQESAAVDVVDFSFNDSNGHAELTAGARYLDITKYPRFMELSPADMFSVSISTLRSPVRVNGSGIPAKTLHRRYVAMVERENTVFISRAIEFRRSKHLPLKPGRENAQDPVRCFSSTMGTNQRPAVSIGDQPGLASPTDARASGSSNSEVAYEIRGDIQRDDTLLANLRQPIPEHDFVLATDIELDPVVGCLGQGASGDVWAAFWMSMPVAVKQLPRDVDGAKVRHECDVLKRLRSPYLVTFYGYTCDANNNPCRIVVERLAKFTIEFATRQPVALARDLAFALTYLHEAGIIHRDVKLSNMLWDEKNQVFKLSDLGEAQLLLGRVEATYTYRGTEVYMAPEVKNPRLNPTPAVDIFAYAVTVIHASTGKRPNPLHDRDDDDVLVPEVVRRDADIQLLRAAKAMSEPQFELLLRCLAQRPKDRPTARECAAHFDGTLE